MAGDDTSPTDPATPHRRNSGADRQRRTELSALLDAMMQEAHDAAMLEAMGAPATRRREYSTALAHRKKVEIYSAGCPVCREAEAVIRRIAGAAHDVEVLDMHQAHVARQAARRGLRSVPRVVVNGQLVVCSTDSGGVDEAVLRSVIAA